MAAPPSASGVSPWHSPRPNTAESLNTIAPFTERAQKSGAASTNTAAATGPANTSSAAPRRSSASTAANTTHYAAKSLPVKQQQQQQPTGFPARLLHSRSKAVRRAAQPAPALHAAARIAAAEAAVSAATAALTPSTAPHLVARGRSNKPLAVSQQQQQLAPLSQPAPQQQDQSKDECQGREASASSCCTPQAPNAFVRTPIGAALLADCLRVQRSASASPSRSLLPSPVPAAAASAASSPVADSNAFGAPSSPPAAAEEVESEPLAQQYHRQQQQSQYAASMGPGAAGLAMWSSWLQSCLIAAAPWSQQHRAASAAEQLAAHGIRKRLRAQLRSAHGPPPFTRSPPPRQPPPPSRVLDGDLLLAQCQGALAPEDVQVVDLSSNDLSSVEMQPTAAPATEGVDDAHVQAALAGNDSETAVVEGAEAAAGSTDGRAAPALREFCNLVSLDLSDNHISCIAGLSVLPGLQQLAVSANCIKDFLGLATVLGMKQDGNAHRSWSSSMTEGGDDRHEGDVASGGVLGSQNGSVSGSASEVLQEIAPSSGVAAPPNEDAVAEEADTDAALCGEEHQSSLLFAAAPLLAGGFASLEVLDVSYNMLLGEQLLGKGSPLGLLPRLSELHAGGNGITSIPSELAAFNSLTLLNLQHNKLRLAAIPVLSQLQALEVLDLSHNPLSGQLSLQEGSAQASSGHGATKFAELCQLDVSSSSLGTVQQLLPLLALMPKLAVLWLVNTPLADGCKDGKAQELYQPGRSIIISDEEQQRQQRQRKHHSSKHSTAISQQPIVTVAEAVGPSRMLAAASKAALVSMPHEQLVAAFERVTAGIDSWRQLVPVPEEDSGVWASENGSENGSGTQMQGPGSIRQQQGLDDEQIEDKTFMTGVGITGQLPGDAEEGAVDAGAAGSVSQAARDQSDSWQDPTERLAVALGLSVSQLAHYTGHAPGNPDGAMHRLRHALTHPLVDPGAGQRPQQHHTSLTAAAAAKQKPQQLMPLSTPIPTALNTRVQQTQGLDSLLKDMRNRLSVLEGTVLQQLQAQATKLATGSAAACCSSVQPAQTAGVANPDRRAVVGSRLA